MPRPARARKMRENSRKEGRKELRTRADGATVYGYTTLRDPLLAN